MKKSYLLLSAFFFAAISFSQTLQQGKALQPVSGSINAVPVPVGVTVSEGSHSSGNHTCQAHDLTEQHFTSQGYDFNQMVMDDHYQISQQEAVAYNKTPGTNTISVIFHVVHNPANPAENVSNALIMQVFNDLVEDFSLTNADQSNARTGFGFIPANPNINFCLATQDPFGNPLSEIGVVRVATTEDWYNSDGGEENKMKSAVTGGSTIWNRNNYLNIWICDISNGASSGTAGYAYRPVGGVLPGASIDGIVLDYNLGMNNENVLTHEVGHYLGLDHTWGGSGSCSSDDGFMDTPNTGGPSFNYPGTCSGDQSVCGATQTQYENYMDYSNCTCMFTAQQANHMLTVLTGIRGSLLLSPGCDPTNTPPNSAFTADIASPIIIPVGATVNLIDQSTNVPTAWSWVISGTAGVNWNYVSGTNATSQDPFVTFLTVGTYNVTLTASNGFGTDPTPATQTAYIQVVAPASGTGCDTLRNYSTSETLTAYFNGGDWGFLPGHGEIYSGYPIDEYAEPHTATSTSQVRRLRVPVAYVNDVSGTGFVTFHVRSNIAGNPGAILASETVLLADLVEGFYNEIDFTTPASVTGNFWVGMELEYGTPQDTLVLFMPSLAGRPAGVGTTRMREGTLWYPTTEYYALPGLNMSIAWDVLLSNGPAPVADMTFSETEVCPGGEISVNGSGSTNTTNYYWYQTDEPVTTIIDDSEAGAATFTFATAGDYNIFLFADGSCMTDGIVLPVTVNPAVTAGSSVIHTSCGNANGQITVTGAAGGNGTYQYKLNSGSWQTSNVFTNLPSGTYTVYVRTQGDNCETSFSVVINASTAFTATVSANQAICLGGNANITAGGGVTYAWSDGATSVGATALINVSPPVTTAYSCLVTNGSGCQSLVSTTITVNPLDDASFDFFDFCDGASNSAVNIATPGGTFSFNPAPGDGAIINGTTGEISNEVIGSTYSVQYTTNDVCTNTSVETVTVNAQDDPQFTSGNYCSGGVNTVTGIATPGGTFTYDGADASSINSSTGVITGGVAGTTYNIIYTTPSGVCQAVSSPVSVTVLTTPNVSAVGNQTVCDGSNFTAINFAGTGGSVFNWTNSNASIGLAASGSGNIGSFAGDGTIPGGSSVTSTVTVTPVLGTCSGSPINFTLTVNSLPNVDAGADQIVCIGTDVTLSGSGAVSYIWDNGVSDGVAFTPSLGTLTYNVIGTGSNSCQNTDQVQVTVNDLDDPSFNSTNICEGDINIVTGILTPGGIFSYDGSDGSTLNTLTGVITGGVGGNSYNLVYTTPPSSCQAVSSPVVVTVFENPSATGNITNDSGTSDGAIDITVGTGTGPFVFDWDHGPTSEDVTGLSAGTYGVIITDANGCSGYESFDVISVVGVDQNDLSKVVSIYPNPTNESITISLEGEFQITIHDSRGRILHVENGTDNLKVDLTNFESAIYYVTIQKGDELTVKKVVKN